MGDELQKQITYLEKLLKKEENKFCIDCRRKSPTWASITVGVFMCIKCSGFHREIGVHITFVKSTNLDKWPKGIALLFGKTNNKIANQFWEYKLKDMNYQTLQNDDNRLRDFIFDKYERRRWVNSKVKDPFTLIKEGKEPMEMEEEQQEEEEIVKKVEKKVKKEKKEVKVEKEEITSSTTVTNAPMIDFSNQPMSTNTNICTEICTNEIPKQTGFTFINKNPEKIEKSNSNLIDIHSHESQKDNQLKKTNT